jgi:hypothetical protein
MNAMRLIDDRLEDEDMDSLHAKDNVDTHTGSSDDNHVEAYKAYKQDVSDMSSDLESSDGTVHMRAMRRSSAEEEKFVTFRSSLSRAEKRLSYPVEMRECLAGYITIDGMRAWTLFDLGSDCDAISPAFVQIAKIKTFELPKPIALELGCKGSKSKITHGTNVIAEIGPILITWYFDVANIVHYNAIVGMPFCSCFGLTIDVKARKVYLSDGSVVPTSLEGGRTGRGDKFAK